MYLINIQATYKNMDFSSLEKWTSLNDEKVIDHFKDVSNEILILRTCNRFEIYIVPKIDPENKVNALISQYGNANVITDRDAVIHIIEVASGMDSMIPGEQDIQRQVKEALKRSMERKTSGKMLNFIFMRALNISKEVRSKTRIGNGIISIPQSAFRILESMIKDGKIAIIGTGKVANSLLKYMNENYKITVFGRNREKLNIIKEKYGVNIDYIENIENSMENFEAILSAVSVNEPILRSNTFKGKRPFIVIDLGNPRNIEKLNDRYYIDLDYIKEYVNKNITQRKSEMEKARKIIEEKIERIEERIKGIEIEELISKIFIRAMVIKDDEVNEAARILGNDSRYVLEKFGNSMVKKIYSNLTEKLRNEGKNLDRNGIEILKRILG
ncbi:MAG: NAD(P)-binding domain-containing protein [Thermoplasmata archaeon]